LCGEKIYFLKNKVIQCDRRSLQESRFVLMFYVRSELDLGLNAGELARFVKRHGVRTVEDVVSGLKEEKKPVR